jgi:hypothetical protein
VALQVVQAPVACPRYGWNSSALQVVGAVELAGQTEPTGLQREKGREGAGVVMSVCAQAQHSYTLIRQHAVAQSAALPASRGRGLTRDGSHPPLRSRHKTLPGRQRASLARHSLAHR